MLSKAQKTEQIGKSKDLIQNSKVVVFTDFSGTDVASLTQLRQDLRELGAEFRVFKKRLLRIAFSEHGTDFNPGEFEAQVGTVFSPKELIDIAGIIFRFEKAQKTKGFNILAAYNVESKDIIPAETVRMIGQLPSREVLLGQLVGMIAISIKMLLYVLNEKAKMVGQE